jgi:hypothetical protein
MFVMEDGTPPQTEECRIPYAEEYLESIFRLAGAQQDFGAHLFSPTVPFLTLLR